MGRSKENEWNVKIQACKETDWRFRPKNGKTKDRDSCCAYKNLAAAYILLLSWPGPAPLRADPQAVHQEPKPCWGTDASASFSHAPSQGWPRNCQVWGRKSMAVDTGCQGKDCTFQQQQTGRHTVSRKMLTFEHIQEWHKGQGYL